MRQWLIDPKLLCNKHLLGEHVEHHMVVGSILKNKSIKGFIEKGLIQTTTIKQRHLELAKEMQARGFLHKSPLPKFEVVSQGYVDIKENLQELIRRCPNCKARILYGGTI